MRDKYYWGAMACLLLIVMLLGYFRGGESGAATWGLAMIAGYLTGRAIEVAKRIWEEKKQ